MWWTPCQGFSSMNWFNAIKYSLFQSSLVSSYLSCTENYRRKFFTLENVKNFANFKISIKSCLHKMGYQCTFGIMQEGRSVLCKQEEEQSSLQQTQDRN